MSGESYPSTEMQSVYSTTPENAKKKKKMPKSKFEGLDSFSNRGACYFGSSFGSSTPTSYAPGTDYTADPPSTTDTSRF